MERIKHVVVLMLENRSFDQMLGCFHPKVNGVPHDHPYQNPGPDGPVSQRDDADPLKKIKPDPKHETPHVLAQIKDGNAGFVLDYAHTYPDTDGKQWQTVMSYYAKGTLPALHALAEHFTICDQWFASVPGPTWANRLFAHSGTSQGWVDMPSLWPPEAHLHPYDQETIFDVLDAKPGTSWRIYYDDFSLSLLLKKLRNLDRIRHHFREFGGHWEDDVARPAAEFPNYVFIEPNYLLTGQNDDHPPCRAARGDALIARVYNAIRGNAELWASTLLVVLFDEHGGFYDHVQPESATSPDDLNHEHFDFRRYGVRVPALLVSPWVATSPCTALMDHTSLLRFVIDCFGLAPDRLGKRVAGANTFMDILLNEMRQDTPAQIPGAVALDAIAAAEELVEEEQLSDLQESIITLSRQVEDELTPTPYAAAAAMDVALPPRERCEVAKARMQRVAGLAGAAP